MTVLYISQVYEVLSLPPLDRGDTLDVWARWENNASRLAVLPIEGVLADGIRPCDTHGRTIAGDSTVSAPQQWAVSCSGGGSRHHVGNRIRSPRGFVEGSSSRKPPVLSSRLPGASRIRKRAEG